MTCHGRFPDDAEAFGTAPPSTSHEAPLSRDSSTRTDELTPRLCVHRMVCVVPMVQAGEVLGVVTVRVGVPVAIWKFVADIDAAVPSPRCAVTRTRAVDVAGASGVHEQLMVDPGRLVHPGIATKVAPALRDSSTSNVSELAVADHWMDVAVPMKTFSPPAGATSVTASGAASIVTTTVAMLLAATSSLAWNVNWS